MNGLCVMYVYIKNTDGQISHYSRVHIVKYVFLHYLQEHIHKRWTESLRTPLQLNLAKTHKKLNL